METKISAILFVIENLFMQKVFAISDYCFLLSCYRKIVLCLCWDFSGKLDFAANKVYTILFSMDFSQTLFVLCKNLISVYFFFNSI